jgi:hypothetical protein
MSLKAPAYKRELYLFIETVHKKYTFQLKNRFIFIVLICCSDRLQTPLAPTSSDNPYILHRLSAA